MEKVHEVDLNDPTSIPFREEIKSQMVFKLEDIAAVVYVNVDPYFAIAGELEFEILDHTQKAITFIIPIIINPVNCN